MRSSLAVGLAAAVAGAQAVFQGFNYGATQSDGYIAMEYDDYKSRFSRAQNLPGTSGFSSARLYTMIQSGTTSDISSAFQAAIDTKTSLLLGVWCSGGQEVVSNEISALKAAIEQLGDDFTSLVVGISVGSEDLYRITPTGIENKAGIGAGPDDLVNYIKQVKQAISGTALSGASIGHVDTWTAWVNGSNSAVIDAVDWLGMDTYPYFQTTVANSIENGNKTFWDAYDVTDGVGNGKEVWITETGWPVSGDESGQAVANVQNAETYWQEVGCALFGKYNTWWYTLEDSIPKTPNPSFGIIGSDINSDPLYDLKCKKQPVKQETSSAASASASGSEESTKTKTAGGNQTTGTGNQATPTGGNGAEETGNVVTGSAGSAGAPSATPSASASGNPNADSTGAASQASPAIGAAILAIFALVASL